MARTATNGSPSPRNTATHQSSWLQRRFNLWRGMFFLIYALVAVVFYFWIVVPYLQVGDLFAPRLLADSITYQGICRNDLSWDEWYWLRDAGPCISLHLLNQSTGLVTLANALLMTIPSLLMARSYGVSASKVLLLLLINPMSFLSLFGPNKEVFGIACTMCLLVFLRRRTVASLVATLIFAMCARLSMLAVVVLLLPLMQLLTLERFGARPWRVFRTASLALLLALSAFTLILGNKLEVELLGDILGADDNSQSTLISLAMEPYTANGLFVLTYIVRLLLNLFGALPNIASVSFETHGVYYLVGVVGSSFLFLAMALMSIFRHGRQLLHMHASAPHILLFAVFDTLILCVSPVIQHRYFFPLYPVLILALVSQRITAATPARPVRLKTLQNSILTCQM